MTPLIDTHQHLVYPEVAGYGWTAGIPALEGQAFRLEDYKAVTDGKGVVGAVFMETAVDDGDIIAETDHVAGLMADAHSGIMGLIVSARPEEDECLPEWLDTVKDKGAVGVRRILHVVDDEMSRSETFRANVRRIGAAGLAFDMCFLARQLPIARELAAACPDMPLILDHCGVPDIAGGGLDPWRADMAALAQMEHVSCKLSGIPAYCAPGEATLEAMRPYVDHVLEVFGPSRICWGSDWPVVNMGPGLPTWLEITQEILGSLSPEDAKAIGTGTATRVYGLS